MDHGPFAGGGPARLDAHLVDTWLFQRALDLECWCSNCGGAQAQATLSKLSLMIQRCLSSKALVLYLAQ